MIISMHVCVCMLYTKQMCIWCLCVVICMYVCLCVCIYVICMVVSMYGYIYVCMCMYVIRVCYMVILYVCMYVCMLTRRNREVVDFKRYRVNYYSKLTNFRKFTRIEGYNGKYGSNPQGIKDFLDVFFKFDQIGREIDGKN